MFGKNVKVGMKGSGMTNLRLMVLFFLQHVYSFLLRGLYTYGVTGDEALKFLTRSFSF